MKKIQKRYKQNWTDEPTAGILKNICISIQFNHSLWILNMNLSQPVAMEMESGVMVLSFSQEEVSW